MTEQYLSGEWVRIDLAADPEMTDALANFLTEIGAEGVYQESLSPLSFTDEVEGPVHYEKLTAHFPREDKESVLASLETYLESLSLLFPKSRKPCLTLKDISDPDWGEEWKKYFHPFRIGKKFVIKPTWEFYQPVGDDMVIEIDPGMAFGTGQHHSTAMCLQAMEDLFETQQISPASSEVLDVGTGTGILGIAAVRLGVEKNVVCLDIDEKAVAIARENAIVNRAADKMEIHNRPLSSLRQKFHLILANLTAKTLLELANELESLLTPGGCLVISGIIEQQSRDIEERFSLPPLRLLRIMKSEEWRCYVITKE